ncbi:PAS domain-containing sensor histidine kinase [Cucumibacter marinus]|uniref:PAS domain-containing sensor histidine kinase n=1 Tax=Cucumibacter marinus TaxID=1121252 RepID=UPI00040BD326|nr:PAS domain-containing sensor histidine kinase [Cucumibacter marinus]
MDMVRNRVSLQKDHKNLSGIAWAGVDKSSAEHETIWARQGGMGPMILNHDWASTALGPISSWGPALRSQVTTMLSTGQPMALWLGPELVGLFNNSFVPVLGARRDAALGIPLSEVWPDVWEDVLPLVRRALSGETFWLEDLPLVMTRNGYDEQTYWTFSYGPAFDDEGCVIGFQAMVYETTATVRTTEAIERVNVALEQEVEKSRKALQAQKAAERRRDALQRELVHRMKNMSAIVQSLAVQSLRHADDLESAEHSLTGRLASFARIQDLFSAHQWHGMDIKALIEAVIAPYQLGEDGFVLDGPAAPLGNQHAMGIALAFHELATNATKYGSLSVETGRVVVEWQLGEDNGFTLTWREEGGPEVTPPARKGFGSTLTQRIVADYFAGKAETRYHPEGVVYQLTGALQQHVPDKI